MKDGTASPLKRSVAAALDVRPGEGRLLLLPLLLFFLKGISDVFVLTSAGALFLKEFGNASLPKVYMASAALVTIFGLMYSYLSTRLSVLALLRTTVIFCAVTIGVFHFGMTFLGSRWWSMGLMIWREVSYMLLNVAFWAQTGLFFNVRQSKRLFPLIAAGDIGSAAVGGAAIPFIVSRIGPVHLLFFAEISTALCLIVSAYLGRVAASRGSEDLAADARPISKLIRDPYVALFMVISVVSFVIYFFADYNFYDVVNSRYRQAESLAAFLGVFYAALNGLNLVVNFAIAGRVLKRYGTYAGVLVLPICVGAGTIAAIGFSAFGITTAIFWSIVGMKLVDELLRGAFLIPAFKILCQPLPQRVRLRVQAVRDSIVEPVAIGFSGLVLLLLTYAAFGRTQLLWILLLVLALFLTLSWFLREQYVVVLGKSLSGSTSENPSPASNSETVEVLARRLASVDPEEVIRSFMLIQRANPLAAKLYLPQMLKHPVPEVRLHGLKEIRNTRESRATGLVRSLIETEEVSVVKSEALLTLSLLNEGKAARRDT
jgi:AAA family ATP:ADP antiporter